MFLAGSELSLPIHSFCCSDQNLILHLGNYFCFRSTLFNPLGYLTPQFEFIFLPNCFLLLDQNIFVIELEIFLSLSFTYISICRFVN